MTNQELWSISMPWILVNGLLSAVCMAGCMIVSNLFYPVMHRLLRSFAWIMIGFFFLVAAINILTFYAYAMDGVFLRFLNNTRTLAGSLICIGFFCAFAYVWLKYQDLKTWVVDKTKFNQFKNSQLT